MNNAFPPWPTFDFLLFTFASLLLRFLIDSTKWQNKIGPLAAGLDGRVIRLGLGRKELRKTWINPRTHFSNVGCLAIALLNFTTRLPTSFRPTPLTLFAPQACSSLLQSLCPDTRLVIPNSVIALAVSSLILLVMTLG
jgi:hypothetical protein